MLKKLAVLLFIIIVVVFGIYVFIRSIDQYQDNLSNTIPQNAQE